MSKLLSLVILSRGPSGLVANGSPPAQQPVPAMVGVNNSTAPAETYNPDTSDDRMVMPPPVSGQAYPGNADF